MGLTENTATALLALNDVTFGSVLKEARFRDRLMGLLREHPGHYAAGLEKHSLRHLEPFANGGN
jgi:hypothetical protein